MSATRRSSKTPTTDPSRPERPTQTRVRTDLADLARLQRTAGNVAVAGILQRRKSPAGPSGTSGDVSSLESAVGKDDQSAAAAAAARLHAADSAWFVRFIAYKLHKHRQDAAKREAYVTAAPAAAHDDLVAHAQATDDRWLGRRLAFSVPGMPAARRLALAQAGPTFWLTVLLPTLKEQGAGDLVRFLQDRAFVTALRADATAFGAFAATTPLLAVAERVSARTSGASDRKKVDRLFREFIRNRGIDVGYSATAAVPTTDILVGDTSRRQASVRAQQSLLGAGADRPSTDCHHLLYVFETLLATVPGLDVTTKPDGIKPPVLTKPMSQLPGGLIPTSFGGNVADDDGKHTGQIFFTGGADVDSHSWLKVDAGDGEVPYDPLFGTKGAAVAGAVSATYERTGDPRVFRKSGTREYLVKDPALHAAPNVHGFTSAYRRTRHLRRYGVTRADL